MHHVLNRWARTARSWWRARQKSTSLQVGWVAGRLRASPEAHAYGRSVRQECNYYVYVPAGLTRLDRVPLLVMLHGCKQNARLFAEGTRMNELADLHRFIVLYPEQSARVHPLCCWRWFERDTLKGAGDAAVIAELVRTVARRYPVDRSRVYVAGMSAGGAMASILVLCYGAMFAACAIVSGVMYRAADSVLEAIAVMRRGSRRPPGAAAGDAARKSSRGAGFVPALVMHGDRDSAVNPLNADQIIEQFREVAQVVTTAPAPLAESAERRVTTSGRAYRQRDYVSANRVLLRQIIVEGLGHAWSGGDERHPFNDAAEPDASQLIWEFVSEFRRSPGQRVPAGAWWSQLLRALRGA